MDSIGFLLGRGSEQRILRIQRKKRNSDGDFFCLTWCLYHVKDGGVGNEKRPSIRHQPPCLARFPAAGWAVAPSCCGFSCALPPSVTTSARPEALATPAAECSWYHRTLVKQRRHNCTVAIVAYIVCATLETCCRAGLLLGSSRQKLILDPDHLSNPIFSFQ